MSRKKTKRKCAPQDKEQEKNSRKEEVVTLQILLMTQVRYTWRSDHWFWVVGRLLMASLRAASEM